MSFFLFKDRGEKTNQNNRKKSEDGHICQLIIIIIIIIINEEEEEDDDHEQNKQTKTHASRHGARITSQLSTVRTKSKRKL